MTVADTMLNQHAARTLYVHGIADTSKLTPGPWNYVGATGQPAFQHSWTAPGTAPFAKPRFRTWLDDRIQLDGFALGGATGTVMFTLPSGFIPTYGRILCCQIGMGGLGYVYVDTSGNVSATQVSGNIVNGVFLDDLTFSLT